MNRGKPSLHAKFNRRVARLPPDIRAGTNMWLAYLTLARSYTAAGNLGRVAWCLDGAAICRRAIPEIRAAIAKAGCRTP